MRCALCWLLMLVLPCGAATAMADDAAQMSGETACAATWALQYKVSGGFAGMRKVIRVQDDARLEISDENSGKLRSGLLLPPEIAELARLVNALFVLPANQRQLNSACNDCVDQELLLTLDDKDKTFYHQSGGNASPQLTAVLQFLSRFLAPTDP